MQKLIEKVLNKYNTGRNNISNHDLALLIISHIKVGFPAGKKGWYLDLSNYKGQHDQAREIIEEYADIR